MPQLSGLIDVLSLDIKKPRVTYTKTVKISALRLFTGEGSIFIPVKLHSIHGSFYTIRGNKSNTCITAVNAAQGETARAILSMR